LLLQLSLPFLIELMIQLRTLVDYSCLSF
jgi:hypothetical protein